MEDLNPERFPFVKIQVLLYLLKNDMSPKTLSRRLSKPLPVVSHCLTDLRKIGWVRKKIEMELPILGELDDLIGKPIYTSSERAVYGLTKKGVIGALVLLDWYKDYQPPSTSLEIIGRDYPELDRWLQTHKKIKALKGEKEIAQIAYAKSKFEIEPLTNFLMNKQFSIDRKLYIFDGSSEALEFIKSGKIHFLEISTIALLTLLREDPKIMRDLVPVSPAPSTTSGKLLYYPRQKMKKEVFTTKGSLARSRAIKMYEEDCEIQYYDTHKIVSEFLNGSVDEDLERIVLPPPLSSLVIYQSKEVKEKTLRAYYTPVLLVADRNFIADYPGTAKKLYTRAQYATRRLSNSWLLANYLRDINNVEKDFNNFRDILPSINYLRF